LNIQEPISYLQPIEINFLYQFNHEYSFLEPYILYADKNKIPTICIKPHISISSDYICALLFQNQIIPYKTYVVPTSGAKLLILRNNDQFFVTFQKSYNQFIHIAKGNGVSESEFLDYLECIWEAYNLKGFIKYYWRIKSFFTMIYLKYLFYVVKIFSYLFSHLLDLSGVFDSFMEGEEVQIMHPCAQWCACLFCLIFYVPYAIIIAGTGYTVAVLSYYAIMLPFFVLAFPLKHFILGFNLFSFLTVSQTLASLYVCFFPQIKKCMPWSCGKIEKIESENILPEIIKRFEIKPQKIMSVVPLLVHKRKKCFVEILDTFMLSIFIFIMGFLISPILLVFGIYFWKQN